MRKITSTTLAWIKATKLTPLQLIYVVAAIFVFIFMATDIFAALPDFAKAGIYGGSILVGVLLGVSIFDIKKIAAEMKAIYVDKNKTAEQKVNAYGNLALQILYKLGEAWEEFHNEQFEDVKQKEIERLHAEINKLTEELNNK